MRDRDRTTALAILAGAALASAAPPAMALDLGLRELWNQLWTQASPAVAGNVEAGDRLGSTAHSGDFDGDGCGDLVMGVPEEKIANDLGIQRDAAGVLNVLYGRPGGLSAERSQLWYQGSSGISGNVELADRFGTSLASGFVNDDPYEDLVVGVPNEDVDLGLGIETEDVGVVHVIPGSADGLVYVGSQLWSQETPGISGNGEYLDRFGKVLALGDFDDNGFDDLVVGVPNEDNAGDDSGALHVIYAADDGSGLSTTGQQLYAQEINGVPGNNEAGDYFGTSLAVGYFNDDAYADLAVGAPGENSAAADEGLLQLFYGGAAPARLQPAGFLLQDGLDDVAAGDRFADVLAAGDFNGDGLSDLAIGVPYEDGPSTVDSGVVHILFGSASGLSVSNPQRFSQDSFGATESEEDDDRFGEILVVGDFDADGYDDLAIGVPGEDLGGIVDAGIVHVLYGSPSGLSMLRHRIFSQDTSCVESDAEAVESFGASLAVGDFDCNGRDDLGVGAPDQAYQVDLTTLANAGAMHVLYGGRYVAREFDQDADGDLDGSDLHALIQDWIASGSADEAPFAAFASEYGRFIPGSPPPVSDVERVDQLTDYAPRVWLNEDPLPGGYWPSSVDWALFGQAGPPELVRFANAADGDRYWLQTSPNLATPSAVLSPLFNGEDLMAGTVPVYAFWTRKQAQVCGYDVGAENVDLVYFFYYPYNRGKYLSLIDTTFGHHVGDWEHVTVRLDWRREGQSPTVWSWVAAPAQLYLSAHSFGGEFDWDSYARTDGVLAACTDPACSHPVVFAAKGSHGIWSTAGTHVYNASLGLSDETAMGTAWDTWQDVETFEYTDPATNTGRGLGTSVWPTWMSDDFFSAGSGDPSDPGAGAIYRWGNPAGSADSTQHGSVCIPAVQDCDPIFGFHRLEKGPTGPVSKNVWSTELR